MVTQDGELALALLNTRPVRDGIEYDELSDDRAARSWAGSHGGRRTALEASRLRDLRDRLTRVVLGEAPPTELAYALRGVCRRPHLDESGLRWDLVTSPETDLAARIVLDWAWVHEHLPGRLRPCGNDECRLFLLDRSKAGRARWCSMATCGNRMKARRHYARSRSADPQ